MSYIWVLVVLHLLNGACGDIRKKSATCPAKNTSILTADDERFRALLNTQIAIFRAKETSIQYPNPRVYLKYISPSALNILSLRLSSNFTFENYVGKLVNLKPKLANQFLNAQVKWSNLIIKGTCVLASKDLTGNMTIIFSNPVANADINTVVEGNNLKTSFVNLDFDAIPDSVNVFFDAASDDFIGLAIKLDPSIVNYIKGYLEKALEQALQNQLDQLLSQIRLQDIFTKNADDAAKYKDISSEMQDALKLVGKLIAETISQLMKDRGNSVLKPPDRLIERKHAGYTAIISLANATVEKVSAIQMNDNSGYRGLWDIFEAIYNYIVKAASDIATAIIDVVTCLFENILGRRDSKVSTSGSYHFEVTTSSYFTERDGHIYGHITKFNIGTVTAENIEVDVTEPDDTSPELIELLTDSAKEDALEMVGTVVSNEMQETINGFLPAEFLADELKDAIDKKLIPVSKKYRKTT